MSRDIYFISSGTSSNDLGKSGKNNLSYFGYKQLCSLRKNHYFLENILTKNIEILTSSDRNCVESSLILFSDVPQKTVNVVPYLSNKRDKNNNHIDFFKSNLVNDAKNHYLKTLDFGKNHTLQTLIKDFPLINVDLEKNGGKKFRQYYFNQTEFIDLLEKKINTTTGIIVVLCDSDIIRRILKKISSEEYKRIEKKSFEKSSVWKVEYTINSTSHKINYKLFSKKYPTEKIYEPLEKKDDKYLLEFKGSYIPLFEKLSDIRNDDLLKKLSYSSVSKSNTTKNNEEQSFLSIEKNSTKEKNPQSIISGYSGLT